MKNQFQVQNFYLFCVLNSRRNGDKFRQISEKRFFIVVHLIVLIISFVFVVDLQRFEICQIAEDFLGEILNFIIRQIPEIFKEKCINLSEKIIPAGM